MAIPRVEWKHPFFWLVRQLFLATFLCRMEVCMFPIDKSDSLSRKAGWKFFTELSASFFAV